MTQYFVNRGGGRAPEGPFEESQIVKLIHAGRLTSGYVCAVGAQRFTPLASHALFGRALAQAGVVPAPDAPGSRSGLTLSGKNTSRGLALGAVLAIFGLALFAVSVGAYIMFQNGGMPVRSAVPIDTELLVEVTSVPKLLADSRALRAIDAGRLLNKQLLDESAQALADSFGVPRPQTEALISAISSCGVAARKLGAAAEGGVLLSFSNAAPVNAFLSSRRFSYTGLVAKSGRKYALSAGTPPASANVDPTRGALVALSLNTPGAGIFWFETSKVLFVGAPSFAESVARVVSLDLPSLEQSPSFKAAQLELKNKPNVSGYVDTSKLAASSDPAFRAMLGSQLEGAGPVSASLELVPSGLLSHFVWHVTGAAAAPGVTPPLSFSDRLPAETFAYLAATTQSSSSGAELEARLLDQLDATEPRLGEQLRAGLAASEQRLHLKLADLLGSLGDQAAVALLAAPDYRLTLGEPTQMLSSFAFEYVQALKDEAPARAACQALRAELGALASPLTLEQDADGYLITSKDGALRSRIAFERGTLFFAVGASALVDRAWRAFSRAENMLGSDPAAHAARAALPSTPRLGAWLDLGRVVDTLQQNPVLAMRPWQLAFGAVQATHWTGPDRVTVGFAVSSEREVNRDTYRVDALNLPIVAGLYALRLP